MALHEAKQYACHILEKGFENQDEYACLKKRREKVRIHLKTFCQDGPRKKCKKRKNVPADLKKVRILTTINQNCF